METAYEDQYLIVQKSLDEKQQLWRVITPNMTQTENSPFGGVVLEYLNNLRATLNSDTDPLQPISIEVCALKENSTFYWNGYYELTDLLLIKESLSLTQKFKLYNKYKDFALRTSDSLNSTAEDETTKIYQEMLKHDITFCGYEILTDEKPYEVFRIPHGSYLFALDLWELLFRNELKLKYRCCARCYDFIGVTHGNQQYCSDCAADSKKSSQERSYQNQSDITKIKKRISNRFTTTKAYSVDGEELNNAFMAETGYIEARLNGESRPNNPNFNNTIQSESEYLDWLKEYENRFRIYRCGECGE